MKHVNVVLRVCPRHNASIFNSTWKNRRFSTSQIHFNAAAAGEQHYYKLVIIGGGSGGSALSSIFGSKFGKDNVAVIEPNDTHYYQPMWTLVGSGIKRFEQSAMPMSKVLTSSTWIKGAVSEFLPKDNAVVTNEGKTVKYDYMIVAMGLTLRYDKVKGLEEALKNDPDVCTNYDPHFVTKTMKAIERFQNGTMLFTLNVPIKCPGAPQKIMYLAEDYLRKHGRRDKAKIIYNTSMGAMLGAKKYSDALYEICKNRGMDVNFWTKLTEIDHKNHTATFERVEPPNKPTGEFHSVKFDFMHVGPPCSTPGALEKCKDLADGGGWLDVDKHTLQHKKFSNVFGIGDCTNLPNAKTAAAVASETGVVRQNLTALMNNQPLKASYNGYSSCPLPTSYNKAILAEFDYNWQPLETFPIDQGKESRIMYYVKTEILPIVYWNGLVRGLWEGPGRLRKLLRFGRA